MSIVSRLLAQRLLAQGIDEKTHGAGKQQLGRIVAMLTKPIAGSNPSPKASWESSTSTASLSTSTNGTPSQNNEQLPHPSGGNLWHAGISSGSELHQLYSKTFGVWSPHLGLAVLLPTQDAGATLTKSCCRVSHQSLARRHSLPSTSSRLQNSSLVSKLQLGNAGRRMGQDLCRCTFPGCRSQTRAFSQIVGQFDDAASSSSFIILPP